MTDRYACRRCDWRPDPEDTYGPVVVQAAGHAAEAGHPRCVVCAGSLEVVEIQSCAGCVALTRLRLVEMVERYAMLPGTIGHPKVVVPDTERSGGDGEAPLPGGDALSLLAGGSDGRFWRGHDGGPSRLERTPWRPASRLRRDPAGTTVADDGNDNRAGDAPSLAYELSRWEDDFRSVRGEPAAQVAASVAGAVGYLTARLGWAGSHHPAFDEFAGDVQGLHWTLTRVVAMDDRPQRGVPCFDCGADLLREYGEEHYTCPRCRREYDGASYWLAIRADIERESSG